MTSNEIECLICYENIDPNENYYLCGFNHFFHKHCVIKTKKIHCIFCKNLLSIYIKNIITKRICNNVIANCENNVKFTDIQTNQLEQNFYEPEIRNNQSCAYKSKKITDILYSVIKDKLLDQSDILYNNLRCSKYNNGNFMIKHQDHKITKMKIDKVKYDSDYTMILFLNTVNSGYIRIYNNVSYYDIQPIMGSILILHKDSFHEVLSNDQDTPKYSLRTDIMYKSAIEYNYKKTTNGMFQLITM